MKIADYEIIINHEKKIFGLGIDLNIYKNNSFVQNFLSLDLENIVYYIDKANKIIILKKNNEFLEIIGLDSKLLNYNKNNPIVIILNTKEGKKIIDIKLHN